MSKNKAKKTFWPSLIIACSITVALYGILLVPLKFTPLVALAVALAVLAACLAVFWGRYVSVASPAPEVLSAAMPASFLPPAPVEPSQETNTTRSHYLRSVLEANQYIRPGIPQSPQASSSVSIPLDEIYVPLHIAHDRLTIERQERKTRTSQANEETKPYQAEAFRSSGSIVPSYRQRKILAPEIEFLDAPVTSTISLEDEVQKLTAQQPLFVVLGAPGSGKTTALSWLAQRMAHSGLDAPSTLAYERPATPLPLLLRISEYADFLESSGDTFETFLVKYMQTRLPGFTSLLQTAVKEGDCLFLLDGLDEVNNEQLRNHTTEEIYHYVRRSTPPTGQHFNRFVLTSRIIGYKKIALSEYRHYTLLDFSDEQIEQFLSRWCYTVESALTMSVQNMSPLTLEQEMRAHKASIEQRDQLLEAFRTSPGVRRLATNPLMLTILATIQRSGRVLPQRRIDLYQIITRTFLSNWNGSNGHRLFEGDEFSLARPLLSRLAMALHNNGAALAEREVRAIVKEALADFYEISPAQVRDQDITTFIETLRSNSGLFVESGQGLYSFMHRTFQEYYVAQYLLQQEPEDLKQVVLQRYHDPVWHEPLVLAIADKSGRESRDDQAQVNELLKAVLQQPGPYDDLLQRHLLFVAHCLVDCLQLSIRKALQQQVADELFALYGDSAGAGRYTQLREEIEDVALLWLRAQPEMSSKSSIFSPLLSAWREALYDSDFAIRQEGATHLFAALVPHLAGSADALLFAFVPPLIEIAHVRDLPCPAEMERYFDDTWAEHHQQNESCLHTTELYAFAALRLLDRAGPPGWLRHNWLEWNHEQPELVELLASHSFELGYLLTPVALPLKQERATRLPPTLGSLSSGLRSTRPRLLAKKMLQHLEESDTVRYPAAFLYWQLCRQELEETGEQLPWQISWQGILQREMARGRAATFQASLSLRILLCQGDEKSLQKLAEELTRDLVDDGPLQQQAFHAIAACYLYKLCRTRYKISFERIGTLRQALDLRVLRDLFDEIKLDLPRYTRNWLDSVMISSLLNALDTFEPSSRDEEPLHSKLLARLNHTKIVSALYTLIEREGEKAPAMAFVCLYCLLASTDLLPPARQGQIERLMKHIAAQTSSTETYLLATSVLKEHLKNDVYDSHFTRSQDTKVRLRQSDQLQRLSRQTHLSHTEIDEIIGLCKEAGASFADMVKGESASSEDDVLAHLLTQHFVLDRAALTTLLEALTHGDSIASTAAALLLQHSELPAPDVKKIASKQIARLLASDEHPNRRNPSLDTWVLNDALFDTLAALTW